MPPFIFMICSDLKILIIPTSLYSVFHGTWSWLPCMFLCSHAQVTSTVTLEISPAGTPFPGKWELKNPVDLRVSFKCLSSWTVRNSVRGLKEHHVLLKKTIPPLLRQNLLHCCHQQVFWNLLWEKQWRPLHLCGTYFIIFTNRVSSFISNHTLSFVFKC